MILDETAEAEGKEYFRLGALEVSPDGRLLAWSADTSGAERFTLRIRDLATGMDIETVSDVINGAVVWSSDGRAIAYTEVNENWRTYRARLHELGGDPATDLTCLRRPTLVVASGVPFTPDPYPGIEAMSPAPETEHDVFAHDH